MKAKHVLLLAALGIVGWAVTTALFFRNDRAIGYGVVLDRNTAVTRARVLARALGENADSWSFSVQSLTRDTDSYYLARQPNPGALPLIGTVVFEVNLFPPAGGQPFVIRFLSGGQAFYFDRGLKVSSLPSRILVGNRQVNLEDEAAKAQPAPKAVADLSTEKLRELSEPSFRLLGGEAFAGFVPTEEDRQQKDVAKLYWDKKLEGESRMKLRAEADWQSGALMRLRLFPDYDAAFNQAFSDRYSSWNRRTNGSRVGVGVFLTLAGMVFLLLRIRGRLLLAVILWVLAFAWQAVGVLATQGLAGLSDGGELIGEVFVALTLPFLVGTGLTNYSPLRARRLGTLALVARGSVFSQPVGQNVAAGLLCAGTLAVIPYLVGLGFSPFQSGVHSGTWGAWIPVLTNGATTALFGAMCTFGFIAPLLSRYIRRPWLAGVLGCIVGVLMLSMPNRFPGALPVLLTGILIWAVSDQIFRRWDLLALFAAVITADLGIQALGLLAQPSDVLRISGMWIVGFLALALAGALGIAWKGRAVALEQVLPAPAQMLQPVADRERLRVEFDVARQAQLRMLPASPPQVDGFEIAAVCNPAREVGGDLYDFLELPDGRLGVVVADVSGKGVPAALYMTLTKGLLDSVADQTSDPGEILRLVNAHLYRECRKQVFVTLFLGVLDPLARTFTYARAGHNPPVWWHGATAQASWLGGRGVGLGLRNEQAFDKTLEVRQIRMQTGDAIILYSDGVTEAMDAQGTEYGEERLQAAVGMAAGFPADRARDHVLDDVSTMQAGVPPQDDQTLVVLIAC